MLKNMLRIKLKAFVLIGLTNFLIRHFRIAVEQLIGHV